MRSWLASTEQLANDIQATSGKPIGRVRLGILPSTAHPLVSTLYYSLKERHRLVQLNVREGQGAPEIERGAWYVLPPDAHLAVRKPSQGLWEERVRISKLRANSV